MKQEEWIQRLDRHMDGHQEQPSHDLWGGIEASLNGRTGQQPAVQPKRQARFVSLRRWAAAAALVGAMIGGGYFYWDREQVQQPSTTVSPTGTKPAILSHADGQTDTGVITPEQSVTDKLMAVVEQKIRTEQAQIRQEETLQAMNQIAEQTETAPAQETSGTTVETAPSQPQPDQIRQPEHVRQESGIVRRFGRQVRQNRQLALGIHTGGNTSGWENVNSVQMSHITRATTTANEAQARSNYLESYEEEQKHSRPISFGLTVSYPLTDKFTISTGIVYTDLHSDLNTLTRGVRTHKGQDLYYIGVPLNVQYRVWEYKGLKAYATAGGQADWNVKAYVRQDRVNQDIKKDDLQWSVAAGMGIQYNIIPQVGVYAEPGIRHYFNNGSNLSNYFKDKPTDFNLQLGLRVNL